MRRFISICLASALLLCGIAISESQGQEPTGPTANALFNPEVPTVWHKLGIPQGVGRYKKFRESRINRKGDKPEREKKPKLVKLTDAANLAPEAPKMLQAAAKIKMAEDLAPQKLKALKYLATLGCGCYNKKNADIVEAAVLEGLDDCTVEVRREALMLVLNQVKGGQCGCQQTCNSKSCCSAKIYKKLEEMVNKTDTTGCPAESDSSIRYLAQQVLSACPYPIMDEVEEKEEVEPEPVKPEADEATESGDEATESGSDEDEEDFEEEGEFEEEEEGVFEEDEEGDFEEDEEMSEDGFPGPDLGEEELEDDDTFEPLPDTDAFDEDDSFEPLPDTDGFDEGNDGDVRRRGRGRNSRMQKVGYRRTRLPGSTSINAYAPEEREMMGQLEVTGVVRSVRTSKGNATIVFDEPYEFPVGLNVVIATGRDFASFGNVDITKTGTAVIKIEDYDLISRLQPNQRVRLGVFK